MFDRAAITLGIGPHTSLACIYFCRTPGWAASPKENVWGQSDHVLRLFCTIRRSASPNPNTTLTARLPWLGNLVVRALDLQLDGCEFNSLPRCCRVTSLGNLFAPMCLCRSTHVPLQVDPRAPAGRSGLVAAWLAAVWEAAGSCVYSRQALWCTALGMGCAFFVQCLGQLSLPPSVEW